MKNNHFRLRPQRRRRRRRRQHEKRNQIATATIIILQRKEEGATSFATCSSPPWFEQKSNYRSIGSVGVMDSRKTKFLSKFLEKIFSVAHFCVVFRAIQFAKLCWRRDKKRWSSCVPKVWYQRVIQPQFSKISLCCTLHAVNYINNPNIPWSPWYL